MSAYVSGLPEFRAATERLTAAVEVATRAAVAEASHLVEAETKKQLTLRAHKAGTPTDSAPGEPPSKITGTLARSVKVEGPVRVGFGVYQAQVGPTTVYARAQELGNPDNTWGGHRAPLPARPYLRPGLDVAKVRFPAIFGAAWARALSV